MAILFQRRRSGEMKWSTACVCIALIALDGAVCWITHSYWPALAPVLVVGWILLIAIM
jgi:hypothetical protein